MSPSSPITRPCPAGAPTSPPHGTGPTFRRERRITFSSSRMRATAPLPWSRLARIARLPSSWSLGFSRRGEAAVPMTKKPAKSPRKTAPWEPEERSSAGQKIFPPEKLPQHIAFIMDGNGRWARRLGFERLRGHEKGANALRRITRYCRAAGIPEITFFALSTENYLRRPRREVNFLLKLLKSYLISERDELMENN